MTTGVRVFCDPLRGRIHLRCKTPGGRRYRSSNRGLISPIPPGSRIKPQSRILKGIGLWMDRPADADSTIAVKYCSCLAVGFFPLPRMARFRTGHRATNSCARTTCPMMEKCR